ncbi:MAG: hypothetical protein IJ418_09005 [Clostridia bacterium]|nr:hypothetical protein [Clostridia bacterium]
MPKVGMRHVVAALVDTASEVANQPLTYKNGMIATRAVAADITYERSENKYYADDGLAESDNAATSGTISITGSEFLPEARAALFGVKTAEEDGNTVYRTTSNPSPYIGLGYMTTLIYKGTYKYYANWIHKMQFALSGESARTKGETIEWQDETATGDIMGVAVDSSGDLAFVDQIEFDSAAKAIAWLDAKAGIVSE